MHTLVMSIFFEYANKLSFEQSDSGVDFGTNLAQNINGLESIKKRNQLSH